MNRQQLVKNIRQKKSFLCVGLDTDIQKIPKHLLDKEDPIFEFNKAIIDATSPYCVAFKLNTAFYEAQGLKGWSSLKKTMDYIPRHLFTIADAKRGDIGNTSTMYAQAFFDKRASGFDFNSITVAPYMGEDSVKPFLEFKDKWTILLALTSNKGSEDFQEVGEEKLFERVILQSQKWGTTENLMYVVGATNGAKIGEVRKLAPDHFFLVPGVGAQGGSLADVVEYGMIKDVGLLVNSSRGIIYKSSGEDFAKAAAAAAKEIQLEMSRYL